MANLPSTPIASTSQINQFNRELSPSSKKKKSSSHHVSSNGKPVVYSQPNDTGVGRHWNTQLLYAINFLKNLGNPIRLEDLAIRSDVEGLLTNPELAANFHNNERVVFNEKTGLYSYKPDFTLTSTADLLSLLRRYAPRGGLTVKVLRANWPAVGPAIEELERDGKVLVSRTLGAGERSGFGTNGGGNGIAGKETEGQMKAVFLDEVGKGAEVDAEFRDLWNGLKTPIADELAEELRSAGLNAASSISTATTVNKKNKKGKKGAGNNNRKLKITNTHLKEIDLSKDYQASRK